MSEDTLLLKRSDVASLLSLEECIAAVEEAFRASAQGTTIPPSVIGAPVEGGGFHIKTAGLKLRRSYFAAKLNGNFYDNASRFSLPRIQGLVVLCDARNGLPLAVMDSTELTAIRTGAATAVAAKYLARTDSSVVTVFGCGLQGSVQLRSICKVRSIRTAYVFDPDSAKANNVAHELSQQLGIEVIATKDPQASCRQSHICVTCTPSQQPLLGVEDLVDGLFIAAVGADSEEKQELDPKMFTHAKLVVDHLDQCAAIGELHHALDDGVLEVSAVHSSLDQVVVGIRPGRTLREEIFVYDSTGVALQDVAAAAVVYEKALVEGVGADFDFNG